jgi:serine protease
MPSRRSIIRTILLPGFVLIVLKLFSSASAQQPEPAQFPVMSAERVAEFLEAADRKLDYLPGEVLVKFKDGVQPAGQQRALLALRSRPDAGQLEWIGDVALLRDASQPNARILAEQLSSQPEVAYAEPNYLRHVHTVPNDPGYSRQWNFGAIGLPTSWDISPGGTSEVIVAVVDTGVTAVTPQTMAVKTWNGSAIVNFSPQVGPSPDITFGRLVSARDFTISSTNPSTFVVDTDGHGTHVASTIGEDTNNSVAEAGIAYNARIMPVKVCMSYWDVQFAMSAAGLPGFADLDAGGCPTSAIAAGIRYAADNGAKVMNISLGGTSRSQLELDALTYAVSRGVFVSISNGNEFEDGNPVSYPASFAATINGAMSVAATNQSQGHAFYSTTGPTTEIAAPGGDSRDGGPAGRIFQLTLSPTDSNELLTFPRFDRYAEVSLQGTSMAAPHVTGVAALLWSRGIRTPATIESLIRQTALDLGSPGKDDTFGYGLIQPRAALFGLGIRK